MSSVSIPSPRVSTVSLLICLVLVLAASTPAALAATYTNFDVPGASSVFPRAINHSGLVTGCSWDQRAVSHGFLFHPNGTVDTFDGPAATSTIPMSINGAGTVVGYYTDSKQQAHGFLRTLDGSLTTLDPPGTGPNGTIAYSIDDAGQVAGEYVDVNYYPYGYLRDAAGNYTTFTLPKLGIITNSFLNSGGEIAGSYFANSQNASQLRGFTRDTSGNLVGFDAVTNAYSTAVNGVNATGQIAGQYSVSATGLPSLYFRDVAGTITTFTIPGFCGILDGIQDNGDIVGDSCSFAFFHRGWQRTTAGVVSYFRDPSDSATYGGTYPTCVSGNGKVAGFYADSSGKNHGFVKH